MRRYIERVSVLCSALSCVNSFSSHGHFGFPTASCTAGHGSSAFRRLQQPHHLLICRSKKRGRWGAKERCCLVLSLSDLNGGEKDSSSLTPLFPELANPEPPPQASSYDEAADALQNLRRGRPSAGELGERALSASDEIRNAMASGGLEGAARAIQKAMGKGGDWYDGETEDSAISELRGDEDMAAQGLDKSGAADRNAEEGSPLTNLDFLLGKLEQNKDE